MLPSYGGPRRAMIQRCRPVPGASTWSRGAAICITKDGTLIHRPLRVIMPQAYRQPMNDQIAEYALILSGAVPLLAVFRLPVLHPGGMSRPWRGRGQVLS
jgi:hypothetical protein